MGRNSKRKAIAKKLMKGPATKFEQMDLSKARFIPKGMTRSYQNNRYMVMVYDNDPVSSGTATRIMVQKLDDTHIIRHWSELQKIKNEIFGPEVAAIEYYPPESELLDKHNIYWLWIFPEGIIPKTFVKNNG